MSESLSNDRRNEIAEQVHEALSMTILRAQFFLQDRGVEFLPSEATVADYDQSEFMTRVRQTVAEQEESLGRMLMGDELADVMAYYLQEITDKQRRLEIAAQNSFAIIDVGQMILSYWDLVHSGSTEAAAALKQDLYMKVKNSGLSDAWYQLLDTELAE